MTERPQYPDSTGSHWDAARGAPANERPAFLDRTEPMSQQQREAAGASATLDELMGSGGTSRLPSQQQQPQQPQQSAPPVAPAAPTSPAAAPPPATSPPAPQWPEAPAPPQQRGAVAEPMGDPELAAAVRRDQAPEAVVPPQEPPRAPASPHHTPPPAHTQPPQPPPPGAPAADGSGLHEPTQVHNPVSPQTGRGRTYPSQATEGTYQRRRQGLGMMVILGTLVAALLTVYMLVRTLAAGAYDPSALLSGGFALIGLPLTAAGLYPLLGAGSAPDERSSAVLRAPYIYLLTGIALLAAAGLAA